MAKPVLLGTRKLPEAIEARAAQDYDARLNPQDAPWARDGAEIARRATEASAAGILGAAGDYFDSLRCKEPTVRFSHECARDRCRLDQVHRRRQKYSSRAAFLERANFAFDRSQAVALLGPRRMSDVRPQHSFRATGYRRQAGATARGCRTTANNGATTCEPIEHLSSGVWTQVCHARSESRAIMPKLAATESCKPSPAKARSSAAEKAASIFKSSARD
jgi:hypothetical protein